jgi:small GTP-binding protein
MEKSEQLLPPENNENNENSEKIKIIKLNDDEKDYDKSIKVIFLGDTNVGKSSVIQRLKNNTFNYNQQPTLTLEHYNLIIKINTFVLRMQIWDTAGQEKFDSITSNYYRSTDVAIFVYGIDNKESFNRIPGWIKELEDKNANTNTNNTNKKEENEEQLMIKILIGNKKDLESERKVSFDEGNQFSKDNGFIHFNEVSCKDIKDDKNKQEIDKIVEIIGKEFYKEFERTKDDRLNSSIFNYQASKSILDSKESKSCFC